MQAKKIEPDSKLYDAMLPVILRYPEESQELQGCSTYLTKLTLAEWVAPFYEQSILGYNVRLAFYLKDETSFNEWISDMRENNILPDLVGVL